MNITLNGTTYELSSVSGKVLETGKNMETRVHGSGGGGSSYRGTGSSAPVTISSTTVIHDQIFLTDTQGREHSFQLQDFNVACRAGNELSVVSIFKQGKPTGDYMAVVNHSTGKIYFSDQLLKKIFVPWKGILIASAAVFFYYSVTGGIGSAFLAALIVFGIGTLIGVSIIAGRRLAAFKASCKISDLVAAPKEAAGY